MSSPIVNELILKAAEPIAGTIRKGKPLATLMGVLLGAGLGASTYFVIMPELVYFFAFLGALVGAFFGAALFQRPATAPGIRSTDLEPFRLGSIVQAWTFSNQEFQSLAVLMTNAFYLVREDSAPWDQVLEQLSRGEDPQLPLGDFIRLDELLRIEWHQKDTNEITFVYMSNGKLKRRPCDLQSEADREELIDAMEDQLGKTLSRQECPLELSRAIRIPAIVCVLVGGFFAFVANLSSRWTANPPPPPRGKTEQDELVGLLIQIGPEKIAIAGVVAFLAALAWLISRIYRPPQMVVVPVRDDA